MRRLILALALCLAAASAFAARIKDISVLRSARDSQLVGYGLVVGLQGSGDTLRNAPFTEQSVQAMLTHLGLDVHGASLRNRMSRPSSSPRTSRPEWRRARASTSPSRLSATRRP